MSTADKYSMPQRLGAHPGRQFHVMAKPSGSSCNLDCKYCFYLSKETLPGGPGTGVMSDETLERFISQYIDAVNAPQVVFSWQGGEPTLRGLEFFRRVVELQKKYAKSGQRIENDLQTNGVLLDEEWAAFLKENRFLVGLSIDGPRDLHDAFRVNKGGAPTFDKVMVAAGLLRRRGVRFNTLTCVHRFNASRPLDVYRFLRRELDATYIQFIPIVQAKEFETTASQRWSPARLPIVGSPASRPGHPDSIVTDWSVDPDEYGYFLTRVFDEWLRKDFGLLSGFLIIAGALVISRNAVAVAAMLLAFGINVTVAVLRSALASRVIYFSFVTLTTTGYGDIVPVQPIARSLCNLEAMIWQIYPATLLARIVTLELEHRR